MNELRLILAGLALPTLGAIWWWSARRGGQAPGSAELRESTAAHAVRPVETLEERPVPLAARERALKPLEPLCIRTDDPVPEIELDEPISAYADPVPLSTASATSPAAASAGAPRADSPAPLERASAARAERAAAGVERTPAPAEGASGAAAARTQALPAERVKGTPSERKGAPSERANAVSGTADGAAQAAEQQRIVAVRLCAVNEARWPGQRLLAALEAHGLAFGRYQVFHRCHTDGRSIFCVASLTEPGTFDPQRMAQEDHRGITLFAVLPGPLAPLETLDEMLATARELARELTGTMQDDRGMPLSPQRAAALREDIARFQAHPSAGAPQGLLRP